MKRLLPLLLVLALASPAFADYMGDFPVNATVHCKWDTNAQDGSSITRSTDGTLRIYKNGSATERTSLAGVTQTEDFDSIVGVHHVAIDTSDNTDAGFYAAGSEYQLVMLSMVVDTKNVSSSRLCSWSIERTNGTLALLKRLPTLDSTVARVKAVANQVIDVYLVDSVTGAGKTGLTSASPGLTIAWDRLDQGNAAMATCTPAAATRGSYTSCGFVEKDATNAPGVYQIGLTAAMVNTGADFAELHITATGIRPTKKTVDLVDVGLTEVYARIGAPAGASVAADVASVKSDSTAIKTKTDSIVFTAGNLNSHLKATDTPLTLSLTGNVSGSVGSVTGNVGGNVAGSVGSVTGDVGGAVVGSVRQVSVYRKNVAGQRKFQMWIFNTNGTTYTGDPGTVTVTVNKDGAGWVAATGTLSGGGASGDGLFFFAPSQADTNCDACGYRASASGTRTERFNVTTQPQ